MRIHLIIDFMHLVYRAKSVTKYLSTPVKSVMTTNEENIYKVSLFGKEYMYFGSKTGYIDDYQVALTVKDDSIRLRTTTIYMVLKYINEVVNVFQNNNLTDNTNDLEDNIIEEPIDIDITFCFDSKNNKRKQQDKGYKSNRHNSFNLDDYTDVTMLEDILREIGYNCLKVEGYEADDLVYWVNKKYKTDYDYTIILTNDKDLLYNIDRNTSLYLRLGKDYWYVHCDNANTICKDSYKINMPYTYIMLYKSIVGDVSDGIKGVTRFGKKTFEKLIEQDKNTYDLLNWQNCRQYINNIAQFTVEQRQQALDALDLVKPQLIDTDKITAPKPIDNNKRKEVLNVLGIKSL